MLVARGWDVHAVRTRRQPPSGRAPASRWHRANLLDADDQRARDRRIRAEPSAAPGLVHRAGKWAAAPENFDWVRASLDLVQCLPRRRRHRAGDRRLVPRVRLELRRTARRAGRPARRTRSMATCKHALQLLTSALGSRRPDERVGTDLLPVRPARAPGSAGASVVRSLLAGQPARTSHGEQVRDYLYAGDVADAFVTLLESDVTGPINIASGQAISAERHRPAHRRADGPARI